MFPGQSAQVAGMGEQAYLQNDEAKKVFYIGSVVVGEDLEEICFGSQTDKLDSHLVQPAIVAAELANYRLMRQQGLTPQLMMGHSLGEMAALGASGVLSTEDVFKVTKVRAEVTDRSSKSNPGTMAAVLGLEEETLEQVVSAVNRNLHRLGKSAAVYIANHNWRQEQVLSGHEDAIERASLFIARLKSLGIVGKAGVMKLAVPGAFHSPHNQDGVEEFKEALESVDMAFPRVMLLNNRGQYMIDPSEFPTYYSNQLVNGVEWNLMMHVAVRDGVKKFTEVTLSPDPKKATLTKLIAKEFANTTIVDDEFGQVVQVAWTPEDSEYIQPKIDALNSLQTETK